MSNRADGALDTELVTDYPEPLRWAPTTCQVTGSGECRGTLDQRVGDILRPPVMINLKRQNQTSLLSAIFRWSKLSSSVKGYPVNDPLGPGYNMALKFFE